MQQNRVSLFLLIAAILAIGGLFIVKLAPLFQTVRPGRYLTPNEVRGIAVFHNGTPFTLNFTQQNRLIDLLNLSLASEKIATPSQADHPPIEKISIYRFGDSDIELEPLFYAEDNLIFTCRLWNWNGYMQDTTGGALRTLLAETFDK